MNNLSTKEIVEYLKNEHQPLEYNFSMNKSPKVITLTGANGFLSSYLLGFLCNLKEVEKIYCLVRNQSSFKFNNPKVIPISYNGESSFSLENNSLHQILSETDCFIHCAAQVHNIKSLASLYNSNVALSHAILNKIKNLNLKLSFHLISTLSVFASSTYKTDEYAQENYQKSFVSNEQLIPNDEYRIIGGYAQSKWLSEYIFSQTNAHIIRLGLLTPSYEKPIFNSNEFLPMLIDLLGKVKSIPYETEEEFSKNSKAICVDITPVDYAAKFISDLISSKYSFTYQKNDENYISHIANHTSLNLYQIVNILESYHQTKFSRVSKEQWMEKLNFLKLGTIEQKLLNNTFFRTNLLESNFKYFNIDLFQSSLYNWDYANKAGAIAQPSIIFHKYVEDYYVSN